MLGSLNPTQIKFGLLPVEGVAEPCVELAFRPSAAAIKGWGCMAELDASPAAVQKDTEENPHEFEELGQSHAGGHGGVCDVAQNATGADTVLSVQRSHTVYAYCMNTLLEEVFIRINTSHSKVYKHLTLSPPVTPLKSICRCWRCGRVHG